MAPIFVIRAPLTGTQWEEAAWATATGVKRKRLLATNDRSMNITPAGTRDFSMLSFIKFSLWCSQMGSEAGPGSFIKLMRKNSVFSLTEGNNSGVKSSPLLQIPA
jgi:hypothetical protein